MKRESLIKVYCRRFGRARLVDLHEQVLASTRVWLLESEPVATRESCELAAQGEVQTRMVMASLGRLCAAALRTDCPDIGLPVIDRVTRESVGNPDFRIVGEAVLGSESSWRQIQDLLDRRGDRVRGHDPRDILGDVFLGGALYRYRGEASLGCRLASLRPRKERSRREIPLENLDRFPAGSSVDGTEPREAGRRDFVRLALAELVPEDRRLLLLRFREAWSYSRIAANEGLGHPERARRRVRVALGRLARVVDRAVLDSTEGTPGPQDRGRAPWSRQKSPGRRKARDRD